RPGTSAPSGSTSSRRPSGCSSPSSSAAGSERRRTHSAHGSLPTGAHAVRSAAPETGAGRGHPSAVRSVREGSEAMPGTRYDVIIIGTGAGGGTLLSALAPSGKEILVLERGDFVKRERENWDARSVNVEGRYQTKEVWKDKDGQDLHPHTNYAVGGNTKF